MYVYVKRCESRWISLRNPKKAAHLEEEDVKGSLESRQEVGIGIGGLDILHGLKDTHWTGL